jgi:hypothetical protein
MDINHDELVIKNKTYTLGKLDHPKRLESNLYG